MPYPDLQTMFNNGMGGFAAVQAGQQQAQADQAFQAEQEQKRALLQEQMIKNQRDQMMNPLDLMFRQGQVNTQNAQLPGLQAQSQSLQSQANVDQATEASKIAMGISKASAQIGEDGMKRMKDDSQKATQVAALLDGIPPMQRSAAFQSAMAKYGADPESPFVKSFTNVPPEKLPGQLRAMGQGMAMASEQYITEMAKQKSANDAHIQTAKIGAGATIEAAKIGAEGRMKVAEMASKARTMASDNKLSFEQRIGNLEMIPEDLRTDNDRRAIVELKRQQLAKAAAPANPNAALMLNLPTQQEIAAAGGDVAKAIALKSGQSQPGAQKPVVTTPQGQLKQIGTSAGRPVYEDEHGNRFTQ